MFDPHDWFNIRRNRAVCPVHGKRDRNLEIKRHKHEPKWVLTCHSHHCTLQEIALAAGFNPADIYDNDRDPDWVDEREWIVTPSTARRVVTKVVEPDPFPPNPCTRLHFENDAGDVIHVPCDSKRCHDCGPRKQHIMQQQLKDGFGTYTHIEAIATRQECDRLVERNKKRGKQQGIKHLYQIVGDHQRGFIMISNMELTRTTLQTLADWMERVLTMYRAADRRVRRSWGLGPLSRLTRKDSLASRESPSLWRRVTRQWVAVMHVPDTFEELQRTIEGEEYFKRRDYAAKRLREKGQMASKLAHRGGTW